MKNGYSVAKQVVPHAMLNRIWINLHFLIVKQLERFDITPVADMKKNLEALLRHDIDVYIATLALASRLKCVFDLFGTFFTDEIMAYPSMPVLHVMADTLKVPGGYWGTLAHQDWASTQGSLDTMTVWVPVTNTKDNFPLEVIPDSHKKGLLGGKSNGSVLEVEGDGFFVPVDAEFGDAVIMPAFLVHRTGKGGNGLRVAVSMRYENVKEKTFIERGYPCAQKRVVDREILWKPTVEQVREIFNG